MVLTVIYHVFNFGWLLALGYYLFGAILCALVVTFPLGLSMFTIGTWHWTPFTKRVIKKSEAEAMAEIDGEEKWYKPLIKIANIIWAILFGWWMVALQAVSAVAACLTVIGIPLGLAQFRIIGTLFAPFGVTIISEDEYQALKAKGREYKFLNQQKENS